VRGAGEAAVHLPHRQQRGRRSQGHGEGLRARPRPVRPLHGEELKAFEAERSNAIEITEFVPLASVDFVHVEKSYYLGADKGGDKAYRLLSKP
jgi:hypothetical protein